MFIRPCYRRKNGKRHAYWALMALVLVLCRLCHPSSELHIAFLK